jgi:hypothetical protein
MPQQAHTTDSDPLSSALLDEVRGLLHELQPQAVPQVRLDSGTGGASGTAL